MQRHRLQIKGNDLLLQFIPNLNKKRDSFGDQLQKSTPGRFVCVTSSTVALFKMRNTTHMLANALACNTDNGQHTRRRESQFEPDVPITQRLKLADDSSKSEIVSSVEPVAVQRDGSNQGTWGHTRYQDQATETSRGLAAGQASPLDRCIHCLIIYHI